MDAEKFRAFFEANPGDDPAGDTAVVLRVAGRQVRAARSGPHAFLYAPPPSRCDLCMS